MDLHQASVTMDESMLSRPFGGQNEPQRLQRNIQTAFFKRNAFGSKSTEICASIDGKSSGKNDLKDSVLTGLSEFEDQQPGFELELYKEEYNPQSGTKL